VHNSALKVVKITTLFESTQEKYAFLRIFFLPFFLPTIYNFDFQLFVKIHFNKIFFHFNRHFSNKTPFLCVL